MKVWKEQEELQFLSIWASHINDLRRTKRNKHVYYTMAEELNKLGVFCTLIKVQRKVNNFTQRYRMEKMGVGVSGGSPSPWKYFQKLHRIIGSFACNDRTRMHDSIEN